MTFSKSGATESSLSSKVELSAMSVVVIGHVDHGKSTVVGRLLYDTNTLPHGRIEQVRKNCELSGKPFEYAFLIDALQDEQAQGITIDSARVFFKSSHRRYILIDAPGHLEFLKNMISGAARAEAAILVIDAKEGVQENSRRHGFMAAMLGIKQLVVVVNKLDLVDYDESIFAAIRDEYMSFLHDLEVHPLGFVPVSGRHGDNLTEISPQTPWYSGGSLLTYMDAFSSSQPAVDQALRLPVQDVYKFPSRGDDPRIVAGTVASGKVSLGDVVGFLPSGKRSAVKSIEGFHLPARSTVLEGIATGITLEEELYVRPGEIMYRIGEQAPQVGTTFRCNLFWLGQNPLVRGKRYRLKLATSRATVMVREITRVLNASSLESKEASKLKESVGEDVEISHVGRHDVAECVLETQRPIAFDAIQGTEMAVTGRFVLVDEYEIAGGGIVTEYLSGLKGSLRAHVKKRNEAWIRNTINSDRRPQQLQWVMLTGSRQNLLRKIAFSLEKKLHEIDKRVYYVPLSNLASGICHDVAAFAQTSISNWKEPLVEDRAEHVRYLGEVVYMICDAGQIAIATIIDLDIHEAETLRILSEPNEMLVVQIGNDLNKINTDLNFQSDEPLSEIVPRICRLLEDRKVRLEYYL